MLQFTEETDPELAVIVRYAQDFLVAAESKLGSKGLFVSKKKDVKDKYHASYCGIIGLLESTFSEVRIVCQSFSLLSFSSSG